LKIGSKELKKRQKLSLKQSLKVSGSRRRQKPILQVVCVYNKVRSKRSDFERGELI
jgi:transposase